MQQKTLLVALAVGALLIGAGCGKKAANTNTDDGSIIINEDDFLTNLSDDTNLDANENGNTNAAAANTNESAEPLLNGNTNTAATTNTNAAVTNTNTSTSTTSSIKVTSPKADATLTSPIVVAGTAPKTATSVYARVLSLGGTEIFDPVTISVKSDGSFSGKIPFEFTTTKAGIIEVYLKDSAGTESDSVKVSVKFTTTAATNSNTNAAVASNTNSDLNTNAAVTNTNTGY